MDVDYLGKFYSNVDVYDSYKNSIEIKIKKSSKYVIDVGLEHKKNLMNKAANLGMYHRFVEADANGKLLFDDGSFQTIFSNIIYWLDAPQHSFREIYRILKHGGQCCVMFPNVSYIEGSFYYSLCEKGKHDEFEFLKLID